MIAFAFNSILCRLALGPQIIDATSFTAIRLVSGTLMLLVILLLSGRRLPKNVGGDWPSSMALFIYAILFSFAYIRLDVGTGALILFVLVQITMIVWGLVRGERPKAVQWIGMAVAMGGLVYLVSPGLSAPAPLGAALMAGSGAAWGVYSLRGRGASDPLAATAGNFLRSVPFVLITLVFVLRDIDLSVYGIVLAVASGSLASGLGYVIWYVALRGLSATRAATVQLTVPVIAAAGGIVLLNETVSLRLVVSAVLILGGVGLALARRARNR
jgi:drug/metabolite transporter (DMT)-like permease